MNWLDAVSYAHKAGIKLVRKDKSRLMRLVSWIIKPFSPRFMEDYYTTLWGKLYVPARRWETDTLDEDLLKHEIQHARDMRRWPVLFELSYLFGNLFLVVGPGMRAFWEWRGYRINVRDMAERGYSLGSIQRYVVPQFVYQHYGWMGGFPCWPFRGYWERLVEREYNRAKLKSPPRPVNY